MEQERAEPREDDAGHGWDRLQQAFLGLCFGEDGLAPWALFQTLADPAGSLARAAAEGQLGMAPWRSFELFGELLRGQAERLRELRQEEIDVASAMRALLASLMRNLDILIAAQALAAGDRSILGFVPEAWHAAAEGSPALGLTRNWQLRWQRVVRTFDAARAAAATLQNLQWRALYAGCEHCGRALDAPGPAIASLRGLYDLFVDSVEAAWRETALSEEYASAFGASVNASLAVRGAIRDLLQPLSGVLEVAGRSELAAIERRLRAMESELQTLRDEREAPNVLAASAPAPGAGRRAARRKKGGAPASPAASMPVEPVAADGGAPGAGA